MIFFDANFLISLYVKEHKYKNRATEIWNELSYEKEKIISSLIIPEVITVLNVKLKQENEILEKAFIHMNNNFTIVNDKDMYYMGFLNVLKDKKRLPMFDGIYMAIMMDLGIKKIVSFNEHFDNKEGIIRIH